MNCDQNPEVNFLLPQQSVSFHGGYSYLTSVTISIFLLSGSLFLLPQYPKYILTSLCQPMKPSQLIHHQAVAVKTHYELHLVQISKENFLKHELQIQSYNIRTTNF